MKGKTDYNSENKITNYKRKCKSKKQNNNSENIITSQKHNDKFENKITYYGGHEGQNRLQFWKQNNKLQTQIQF